MVPTPQESVTTPGSVRHFLEGPTLYLREVRCTDVNDNYYRWMNDPEVTQFLETRYLPRSLENIKGFVSVMDGKAEEIFLAICLKDDNRHIGNIKLGPMEWIHRVASISLLIGEKDCWGKGYATEAICLVCRLAFERLNLRKVKAGVYATNQGSIRAFHKVGFATEGVLRGEYVVNRQLIDHVCLGLFGDDFKVF
jgi:[ribosomal protein S5]-alanine N-acetyltransferase